jgi:DNA repair exonuclease SbcCD ATPase subunit
LITLSRVRINDFGPLESFEYAFPREAGTFAVRAPNGSGKSHLVAALQITIAHKHMEARPRAAWIRNYGLNGETAKLEVEYSVDGEPLILQHVISAKGGTSQAEIAELLARGGYPEATTRYRASYRGNAYGAAGEIDKLVDRHFGLRNLAQCDAVFVGQGRAGEIWRQTPGDRARVFQRLSGADALAETHKYAANRLLQYRTVDRTAELTRARETAGALGDARDRAAAELAGIAPADREEIARLHARLAAIRQARRDREEAERIERDIARRTAAADALKVELDKTLAALAALAGDEEEEAAREEEARRLIQRWRESEDARRSQDELTRRIRELETRLDGIVLDDLEAVERWRDDLRAAANAVSEPLNEAVRNLEKFGASGRCPTCGSTGVCPRCGHVELDLEAAARRWQRDRDEGQRRLDDLGRGLEEAGRRRDAALAARAEHDRGSRQLAELEAARAATARTAAIPDPAGAERAGTALKEIAERRRERRRLLALEAEAGAELGRVETAVRVLRDGLRPPGEVDAAPGAEAPIEAELERLNGLASLRGELEGRIGGLDVQLKAARAAVAELEADLARRAGAIRAGKFLTEVRDATHPGAIPKDRAASYIERLNACLDAYGRELRLPFALAVDPDSQDLMFRTDGLTAPVAHRMSAGQRTMCAWAWHLALYALHGDRVGFLVMDEPTAYLDAENRRCVAEAVGNLSRHCRDAGMQCVVVLHDIDLAGAFDAVIELPARTAV